MEGAPDLPAPIVPNRRMSSSTTQSFLEVDEPLGTAVSVPKRGTLLSELSLSFPVGIRHFHLECLSDRIMRTTCSRSVSGMVQADLSRDLSRLPSPLRFSPIKVDHRGSSSSYPNSDLNDLHTLPYRGGDTAG